MFYLILILLFVAVFGFLGWRIVKKQLVEATIKTVSPPDRFTCSICDEHDCVCHKEPDKN